MKRYLSIVLALMIMLSFPLEVSAKPSGGVGVGFTSSIAIAPANTEISAGDAVTLNASWSTNLGVNQSAWYVNGVSQGVTTMKPDKKLGTSTFVFKGLAPGDNEIKFRVWNTKYIDRDANKTITVKVNVTGTSDTTPPVSTLSKNGTLGINGWYKSDVEAQITASDTGGSGVADIRYALNQESEVIYTGPVSIGIEGTNSLRYQAVDKDGNVESIKSETIKIDKTAPEATFLINPSGETTGTVNITVTASDAVSGVGKITRPDNVTISGSTATYTVTANGTYTFQIQDYAGNSSSLNVPVTNIITPTTIKYVSLGDSIATGTTSPITDPTNPYVDQFQAYLIASNPGVSIIRNEFEDDGDLTNDLLNMLKTNTTMRQAVIDADVITVSIGGNNLMKSCKNWLGLYDFFKPNITVANQGYADFIAQWEQIMQEIRSLNEDAVVITMTLYNPYNTSDTYMHELVDNYYFKENGMGMNNLISNLATSYNYQVVDAFTAFNAYSEGMMNQVTLLYPSSLTRNPHPNQFGQNMIFNLHKDLYDSLP